MDCNRFYFPPFYEEDNTSKILTLNIHARTPETDTGGEKKLVLFTKSSFVAAIRKKNSIMLLAWRCHVWTRWLRARWRACSAAHYRTLEVTSKNKKEKKNEAPFQPADDCSLLAEIERSFVERGKSDEGSVLTGRWTAAGRTDNGGKKKLIMGWGEGCLKGQAESWESLQKEKQKRWM